LTANAKTSAGSRVINIPYNQSARKILTSYGADRRVYFEFGIAYYVMTLNKLGNLLGVAVF